MKGGRLFRLIEKRAVRCGARGRIRERRSRLSQFLVAFSRRPLPFFSLRVTKCKNEEKETGKESSSRRARAGSLACSRVKPTRR